MRSEDGAWPRSGQDLVEGVPVEQRRSRIHAEPQGPVGVKVDGINRCSVTVEGPHLGTVDRAWARTGYDLGVRPVEVTGGDVRPPFTGAVGLEIGRCRDAGPVVNGHPVRVAQAESFPKDVVPLGRCGAAATRELEGGDPGTPPGTRHVLPGKPEGAVVRRVDPHGGVVAPPVVRLAAGACGDRGLALGHAA